MRQWILRKIGTGEFMVEGRKRGMVVPAAQFRALLDILDNDRQAYLDEILAELLKPPHNFSWSKTTLQRMLKRLKITRKKVSIPYIRLTAPARFLTFSSFVFLLSLYSQSAAARTVANPRFLRGRPHGWTRSTPDSSFV